MCCQTQFTFHSPLPSTGRCAAVCAWLWPGWPYGVVGSGPSLVTPLAYDPGSLPLGGVDVMRVRWSNLTTSDVILSLLWATVGKPLATKAHATHTPPPPLASPWLLTHAAESLVSIGSKRRSIRGGSWAAHAINLGRCGPGEILLSPLALQLHHTVSPAPSITRCHFSCANVPRRHCGIIGYLIRVC